MHRIFQERPEILGSVFEVLGVPLSEKATVDAVTTDVTETRPLERRVDTVLRIGPSDGEDFLLAIESQSGRVAGKEASWAYYVAYLQAKFRLPVLLLVVCQDGPTAKWAAGPDNLPVITDARTAAKNLFLEVTLGNTPAGEKWNRIMSFVSYFPGRGTVRETAYLEGKTEGRAEGEAKGILSVLEVRGIPVTDSVRERITSCTDLDRMDTWLERSRTVERAEDLFDEEGNADKPMA
ncbi:hypothetical protein ABZ235_03465 [Streptomyces canus]|uniref:hypothetical protein n=1 Tax=Streptomyces canus TaxID=58343 RepID=UPI0033B78169